MCQCFLVGPTGATGATGILASAYGGYYMTETGTLDLTPTPITVPLDLQSDAFNDVSYAIPDTITIVEAGTYLIMVNMSGKSISSEPTAVISLKLAVNGIAQTNTMQSLEFSTPEHNTFVFSNILTLSAGARLSLLISSDPATLFSAPPIGQAAGIVVTRLN